MGRAAVLIGAITVLARVIGFGRPVVFAHTVQAQCLGGALTAVVVPVLAGPARAQAADRDQVQQTSAALLSWAVLLLVPVSAVVAIAARPLVSVAITLVASAVLLAAFLAVAALADEGDLLAVVRRVVRP